MTSSIWFKSPIFFVFLSFAAGFLNLLNSLMYYFITSTRHPLGVYLKPVFFLVQAACLIMFIRSIRFTRKPLVSGSTLSRFFTTHMVLIVVVVLLYFDFQVMTLSGVSNANAFLQLAFNIAYLIALAGTSFWFAIELLNQNNWKWLSVVFFLIGLAFATAFLEPMFFWGQNYVRLEFPSQLALVGTYAPLILMFLAAMATVVFIFWRTSVRNASLSFRLVLLLLVPAFLLPLLWDGYKDGLINFIIRDVFYLGLGYSSYQWYSVSFYLMSLVAYMITWRALSRRSDHTIASSLIIWGMISFPWNGVVPFDASYSSLPGNVISLSSIITGASILKSQRGMK